MLLIETLKYNSKISEDQYDKEQISTNNTNVEQFQISKLCI